MPRKKISIIYSLSSEKIIELYAKFDTLAKFCEYLNLSKIVANYKAIKNRLIEEGLDIEKYKSWRISQRLREVPLNIIFVSDSKHTSIIRDKILKFGLIEYKCVLCNNTGEWLNKQLNLQLDHINGIKNDNRLENLRFLCPNCHTQTENYGSKNCKYKINTNHCINCGKVVCKKSKYCIICAGVDKRTWEIDNLDSLVWQMPTSQIAKNYNVSESAIRKRCQTLGIKKPTRGYWQKHSVSKTLRNAE